MHFDFHWRHIKALYEACLRTVHRDGEEIRILLRQSLRNKGWAEKDIVSYMDQNSHHFV